MAKRKVRLANGREAIVDDRDRIESAEDSLAEAIGEAWRLSQRLPMEAGLETDTPLVPIAEWLKRQGIVGEALATLVPQTRGEAIGSLASTVAPAAAAGSRTPTMGGKVLVRRWADVPEALALRRGTWVQASGGGDRLAHLASGKITSGIGPGMARVPFKDRAAYLVPKENLLSVGPIKGALGQRRVASTKGVERIANEVASRIDPGTPVIGPALASIAAKIASGGARGARSAQDRYTAGPESDIRQRATKALTGVDSGELVLAGALANELNDSDDPEALAAHRIGSRLMAERIGTVPAATVGVAREVADGVRALNAGEDVFGPTGFSVDDVGANLAGVAGYLSPAEEELAKALKHRLDLVNEAQALKARRR